MDHLPTLRELSRELTNCTIRGEGNPVVRSVEFDSRRVTTGSLFVAMRGLAADGTAFIGDAIRRGASGVVCESLPDALPVPVLIVPNARKALAELSWSFYGHPEQVLTLIAVTGTNGKTTVASLLRHVLQETGIRAGLIGTLGVHTNDEQLDTARTTPEAPDLAAYFLRMRKQGTSHVVMEATSIGIDLERTWKLPFQVTIFTNLSRDHLDYHKSWEAYREAKLRLFREQRPDGYAILNADDAEIEHFLSAAQARTTTYSLERLAGYRASSIALHRNKLRFLLSSPSASAEIETSLIGRFNVYNALAVIAAADALQIPFAETQSALKKAKSVRGRAEIIPSSSPFTVIVDYAHTPDALEKILTALRDIEHRRVLTVIGAGGNRDRGKRPLMAATAQRFSDFLVLTSDNPRDEDPEIILDDMVAGLPNNAAYVRSVDRREAIGIALAEACDGDIVLIAGKGHETYQEIQGVRYPFDDHAVAMEWLANAGYRS
ncbi:UDP-N-acetylmuramoyl-L-alanyl-D-glutamate--2,6-diaminopimelate ligase [bacterium]|nr:UDP-N-acetylmuramoyl-L-alanyl-D-glutamate--2,6-diaminopimelate ligase [bacterium]MBU1984323.1 UDP-N-acetylmuramoyl-L-alanyl-D-glutamate--2,6-diaminopimelate ligase [bacterium]